MITCGVFSQVLPHRMDWSFAAFSVSIAIHGCQDTSHALKEELLMFFWHLRQSSLQCPWKAMMVSPSDNWGAESQTD